MIESDAKIVFEIAAEYKLWNWKIGRAAVALLVTIVTLIFPRRSISM